MQPRPMNTDGSIQAIYRPVAGAKLCRPLFLAAVPAGFPSPAEDYVEKNLDLNEYLVKHPAATYFVRVAGDSMLGAGIHHDDILIVDRSLAPVSGRIVVAVVNDEMTVKRFLQRDGRCRLLAENPDHAEIVITEGMDLEIWGVVTHAIHHL